MAIGVVGPPPPATTLVNGFDAAYISYEPTSLASLKSKVNNSPVPSSLGLSLSSISTNLAGGCVSAILLIGVTAASGKFVRCTLPLISWTVTVTNNSISGWINCGEDMVMSIMLVGGL